jgi:hypothetical protein
MADENVGVYPPDYGSVAGAVRVLVGDTTPIALEDGTDPAADGQGQYAWYSDDELEALGEMNGSSPKRVAIWVLSQVAISSAFRLKKWTSEDLTVDGPAITRGIEATLKRLSAEVDKEGSLTGDDEFFGMYDRVGDYRILLPHGRPWWGWTD